MGNWMKTDVIEFLTNQVKRQHAAFDKKSFFIITGAYLQTGEPADVDLGTS